MEITKNQLEKIKKFAKKQIKKNDFLHNKYHIRRTVKIAEFLAKKEKADVTKSMIIAWLHDIEKNREFEGKDHAFEGAKTTEKFLKKIKIKNSDIDDICYAIRGHNKGIFKKTKESGVIWDADKLQAMGVEGTLRVCGYFMKQGDKWDIAYRKNIIQQKFFLKRFRTKTGLNLAKKRFDSIKKMGKQFKRELKMKI
jgi:HD superfamily phosphodiesterase